jgi:hypothetical protein
MIAGTMIGSRVSTTMKWPVLLAVSFSCLLAMSLWFSATAVVPALTSHWNLEGGAAAWLTMSVQLGFVLGALLSALFNVPDLWAPRKVFAIGAFAGALLNAMIPAFDVGFATAVLMRLGTGMTLAMVYPVAMKIIATWTDRDRGLAIGLLVGALTVGSASPHLAELAAGALRSLRPGNHRGRDRLVRGQVGTTRGTSTEVQVATHGAFVGDSTPEARELRVSRPHVGALRDVDVDPALSGRLVSGIGNGCGAE